MMAQLEIKLNDKIYGNGEMEVYEGIDQRTGKHIVQKQVLNYKAHLLYSDLLRKEYQLLKMIESDYVVKTLDLREVSGNLVLVNEFVEGQTLRTIIEENCLSFIEKMDIAKSLFQALDAIHQQRILHKDINPTNLIWNHKKHHLTVIDFNIADQAQTQKIEFVSPEHLKGTLAYISPEQTGRMNRMLDYRSDFYSAGVTLYELFTGVLPFPSGDRSELIHHHIALMPETPYLIEPEVPENLSDIILKLLNKNANERYQSIEGIIYDLENCLSEGSERPFQLAEADRCQQLNISQSIYGRDEVISTMMKGFDKAQQGAFEYHFISGYPGVGKTALTRELYLPITAHSGYFISGKFDQYNSSRPYSAVLQCIEDLINLMLVEEEKVLEKWRRQLQSSLGEHVGVLTQFMPSLNLILGSHDLPPEVPVLEAQNRFKEALQQLFIALGKEGRPIVMFIDDLQWIDQASIQLIKLLFENKMLRNFYFVGAFRNNGMEKGHHLHVMMENINGFDKRRILDIGPLDRQAVSDLVGDTFTHLENDTIVIDKIIDKTKGNPFYIKQLLHHFYDQKCIQYHPLEGKWRVDLTCFNRENVADNVADFLADQLKELSKTLLNILKTAACIGNVFKLQTLENILDCSVESLLANLMLLVDEGYVLALGLERYAFSHDQIQQAAYDLMDAKERGGQHLELAKLLSNSDDQLNDEEIFDIAGHYRQSILDNILLEDSESVFYYLIKAGDLASKNIAYDEALSFYKHAEALMINETLNLSRDQLNHLYNQLIKMFYMVGAFDLLDAYVESFSQLVDSPYELGRAYTIQVQSFVARTQFEKGLAVMMNAFNQFGIDIKSQPTPADYENGFARLGEMMEERSISSLEELPLMINEDSLNLLGLLAGVIPLVFNAAPQIFPLLILEIVCLSIERGQSIYAPIAYAFLGTLLCSVVGDVDSGIQYGRLSLKVLDRLKAKSESPKVNMVVSQHVGHYEAHYDKMIALNERAYYEGISLGDYTYAGFAGHGYCFNTYLAGYSLEKSLTVFETFTNSLETINQGAQSLFQYIYMQTIENILKKEKEPWVLEGQWFNEFEQVPQIYASGHQTALLVYYFNKMQLCYLFNQLKEAEKMADAMSNYLDAGVGLTQVPIYHQYAALIQLAQMSSVTSEVERSRIGKVKEHIKYLESVRNTLNYGHRLKSVLAELARVEGRYEEARGLYEEIIGLVDSYNYIREEAMYRELLYRFYEIVGNEELEHYYKQEAYNCYREWGAVQKLAYFDFSNRQEERSRKNTSVYTLHSLNTAVDGGLQIDLYSILKFSQIMAKEIVYEDLLRKLLYILLENAGAERVVIINFNQDERVVVAENSTGKDFRIAIVNDVEDYVGLPLKILRYAYNGKKIVRLDSAYISSLFSDDIYIQTHMARSILCLPLMSKGDMIGLIYMENNLAEGVFSSERTEFLSLLSSQVAISIENAMVYRHLEELVEQRTNDLAMKNEELQLLNERLRESAIKDGLTGLYNRRKLDEVLAQAYQESKDHQSTLAVILIDLDHFKQVNDVYGHLVGDQVLIDVAQVFRDHIGVLDTVGRWGGEEFLIICPGQSIESVRMLGETLRQAIEEYSFEPVLDQTASFGIALLCEDEAIKDLLKRADDCLYQAKGHGRNKLVSSFCNK